MCQTCHRRSPKHALPLGGKDRVRRSPNLLALARENHRKTREPLGPLVALLSREPGWETGPRVDDIMPPEVMIGSVACWNLDYFTREGRAAMSILTPVIVAKVDELRIRAPPIALSYRRPPDTDTEYAEE